MVKYLKPKKFEVTFVDEYDKILMNIGFMALQKTDNDFLSNIAGERVNETLKVIRDSIFIDMQGISVIGKHTMAGIQNYDRHQLELGIKVEQEHTDDIMLATEIAKDHLAEIPDYYSRLALMERPDFWDLINGVNKDDEKPHKRVALGKRLDELILDEDTAAQEYAQLAQRDKRFEKMSRQERHHYNILRSMK